VSNSDDTRKYCITINGEEVTVNEDVYRAFKRPAWMERKRREVRNEKERSLDAFMDEGFDIPSNDPLTDEIVEDKLLLETLYMALAELTENERDLIDALFYQKKSEHTVARDMGISQNTVNYHKKRVLDKLRKRFKK